MGVGATPQENPGSATAVATEFTLYLLLVARVVTLVLSLAFLPQNLGRWQKPMTGTFSFYDCRLSVDTPTPPVVSRGIAMAMRVKNTSGNTILSQ